MKKVDMFYGGTIAFSPYGFEPNRPLYAPYFAKKDGDMEYIQIEVDPIHSLINIVDSRFQVLDIEW